MKNFTITAEVTTLYEIDIKAKNEKEAQSISNGIDLNDWSAIEDLNFEILSVEEENDKRRDN